MDAFEAVPDSEQDMNHAQKMLARMTPEQLLVATYAMEDILDGAVYVTNLQGHEEDEIIDENERHAAEQGRKDLAEGRTCTLEELLQSCGLKIDDLSPETARTLASTAKSETIHAAA